MNRPIALITGASAGIGSELARVYAEHGYDLILCARREDRLQALAVELTEQLAEPCKVTVLAADLAKASGVRKLHQKVEQLGVAVDVLVNNAGVMHTGEFLSASTGQLRGLINLNIRALVELTHLFLPQMRERGYGRILNVASVAAFQPAPGMSVYGASKAFVLSFTESLSEELNGTGVTVTALCPGPTRTDMADAFAAIDFSEHWLADPGDVARAGFEACEAGQVVRIPGPMNQALVTWAQYQPRWLVRAVSGFAARRSAIMAAPTSAPTTEPKSGRADSEKQDQ